MTFGIQIKLVYGWHIPIAVTKATFSRIEPLADTTYFHNILSLELANSLGMLSHTAFCAATAVCPSWLALMMNLVAISLGWESEGQTERVEIPTERTHQGRFQC